jgi:hypothetical protein
MHRKQFQKSSWLAVGFFCVKNKNVSYNQNGIKKHDIRQNDAWFKK